MMVGATHAEEALPASLAVDFAALLRASRNPQVALGGGALHSRFVRKIAVDIPEGWPSLKKVKAHRKEAQAVDRSDLTAICGNRCADWLANQGARAHDLSPADADEVARAIKHYYELRKSMSLILAEWPTPSELFGELNKESVGPRGRLRVKDPHAPYWAGSHWRCEYYLRRVSSKTTFECQGRLNPSMIRAFMDPNCFGHKLHVAWTVPHGSIVLLCAACGAFGILVPRRP